MILPPTNSVTLILPFLWSNLGFCRLYQVLSRHNFCQLKFILHQLFHKQSESDWTNLALSLLQVGRWCVFQGCQWIQYFASGLKSVEKTYFTDLGNSCLKKLRVSMLHWDARLIGSILKVIGKGTLTHMKDYTFRRKKTNSNCVRSFPVSESDSLILHVCWELALYSF